MTVDGNFLGWHLDPEGKGEFVEFADSIPVRDPACVLSWQGKLFPFDAWLGRNSA